MTSPLWARWFHQTSLYLFNMWVNLFSCLFMAFLIASIAHSHWIFLAFLMYGTMQAGCELSWNLSGPLFSQETDSTIYSALNLIFLGIRGVICPVIAQLIFMNSNALYVFIFAAGLCLIALLYAFFLDRQYKNKMDLKRLLG